MAKHRLNPPLIQKARANDGVVAVIGKQDFDRDFNTRTLIDGKIDRRHAAIRDASLDSVAITEQFAGLKLVRDKFVRKCHHSTNFAWDKVLPAPRSLKELLLNANYQRISIAAIFILLIVVVAAVLLPSSEDEVSTEKSV